MLALFHSLCLCGFKGLTHHAKFSLCHYSYPCSSTVPVSAATVQKVKRRSHNNRNPCTHQLPQTPILSINNLRNQIHSQSSSPLPNIKVALLPFQESTTPRVPESKSNNTSQSRRCPRLLDTTTLLKCDIMRRGF